MHDWKLIPRAGAGGALVLLLLTGCDPEAAKQREAAAQRAELAVSESTAVRVAALPNTGLWSPEHVLERLLRAGVAPRRVDDAPTGPKWMRVVPVVFTVGRGEVYAWIYADSVARRAVTDSLDVTTAAPAGRPAAFAVPMVFVTQNNLAAVITGGSETNQERIALALQAGLPAASPP